jgi:carbon monoxide dehydrogenase subunit G
MRIEGTYTLPATIDRVFAALLDPNLLQGIIPGCERLVQLGPASQDGGVTFEARVRSPHGPVTLTLKTTGIRRPDHLQVEMWGRAPDVPFAGQISVDLVEQGSHTVGAYVLTLGTPAAGAASQEVIAAFCERLADLLYAQRVEKEALIELDRAPGRGQASPAEEPLLTRFQTPSGQIVALPKAPRSALPGGIARRWAQRALWMGAGMLLGITVISVGIGVARWLEDHGD